MNIQPRLVIYILIALLSARAEGQLAVSLDSANGQYTITSADPAWIFAGKLDVPMQQSSSAEGSDHIGAYREEKFSFQENGVPLDASIRAYKDRPVVLFTLTYGAATDKTVAFPKFSTIPGSLNPFSYIEKNFAPPSFKANASGSPWLLFDDSDNSAVISPASHFLVQEIGGDGKTLMEGRCRPKLANVPAGFSQQTLLAVGPGINKTWDAWGHALTDLENVKRPDYDADTGLKYLGYWTDNGAFYYYNYDADLGYTGTLLALENHFRETNIPVGYMQLDSWWYYKTFTGPDGKPGKTKNPKLPEGEWNRYGGLLEYTAHKALFPDGLLAFQQKLGLPLITHNRWVDPASPYHEKYKIVGLVAVDPQFWLDIADYLQANGVMTYEQDWLDRMFDHTPELGSTVDTGDEFLGGMAAGCAAHGLSVQYCMPPPSFILQGSQYPNLTTSRVSDDRFDRKRWHDFLYTSRLASALQIWPWVDVYMSTEKYNVLLSNLSAGMVGFGDEMGKENRDNLMHTVRSDGLIVKPDAPIVPMDSAYLAEAKGQKVPLLASTYTDHAGVRTAYVYAYAGGPGAVHFSPADLGLQGDVYVFDALNKLPLQINEGRSFEGMLNKDGVGYYIVAPVGKSGIAFLGDAGLFVSTGKQRIATIVETTGQMTVGVAFAANEASVVLHGCAPAAPNVDVDGGRPEAVQFDAVSHYFSVKISRTDRRTQGVTTVTFATR